MNMTTGYATSLSNAANNERAFRVSRQTPNPLIKSLSLVLFALLAIAIAWPPAQASESWSKHHNAMSQKQDIVETAASAGSFKTLLAAVEAAGLVETLKGKGPFTVFAPTDDAFAKLPKDQLQALLADKDKLSQVLTYHVVPGQVMASDVMTLKSAKTVQGQSIRIDTAMGVKVDDANVIKTDIVASNGVIHVIDSVIIPK